MTAAFSSYHTSNERFQHTGQVWLPGLGLYHYKAHSYSPTLERLLQPDPIGYADGMNMYAYVRNDPVNYTDPNGLRGFSRQSSCVTAGYVVSYGGTSEVRANLVCPEVTLDDDRRNPGLIERIGDGGGRPPPGPPKPQSGRDDPPPCNLAQRGLQKLGSYGVKLGGDVTVAGLAITGGGLAVAGVSASTGVLAPGGVLLGGSIATGGANATAGGGVIGTGGALLMLAGGSGKAAVSDLASRVVSSRMPKSFGGEIIGNLVGRAVDAIPFEFRICK